jgi:hypothetical protein
MFRYDRCYKIQLGMLGMTGIIASLGMRHNKLDQKLKMRMGGGKGQKDKEVVVVSYIHQMLEKKGGRNKRFLFQTANTSFCNEPR